MNLRQYSLIRFECYPALYDAYGMTLVESGAFCVPSVVNHGGKVGAAALLGENEGCIALDLTEIELSGTTNNNVGCVKKLIGILASRSSTDGNTNNHNPLVSSSSSSNLLAEVAKEARRRALGYNEISCCRGLLGKLDSLNEEE